jgi:hypothetical protein
MINVDADPLAYRGHHVSKLCAERGVVCDRDEEYILTSAAGTLVMRWGGNRWAPTPSTMQQALSAIGAGVRALGAMMCGEDAMVPADEYTARLSTCRVCPMWNAEQGRCRVCGCVTAVKAKLAASRCPEDRW